MLAPHRYFISIALPVIITCFIATTSLTQTLTRVTDISNPVVTDVYESGGGAWIDVNRDGYLDLFVAHGNLSSQNNTLYINDRNGGFIRITSGAITNDGGSSIGSTWGDYNNDGKIDCFVTNRANFGNFFYQGNGDGTFAKIVTGSIVTDRANSNSSSWVDIDGDGLLDLYVVNFQGNDYFYKNNGAPSYSFTRIDTILPVGDGANFSIPGAWGDMNNDRRPDLFVGNAGNQNDELYINNGNLQFTKVTFGDGRNTLGASWGDYDNDGNLDLIATGYVNEKCILYHNSGPAGYTLTPVAGSSVSADSGNFVGSAWGDFNNDGYLDLFLANDGGPSELFLNDGPPNYTFTEVTTGDPVESVGNSFGAVWVDYDGDGFLDLFVANRANEQNFLYHNGGNGNHWMEFDLTGTASNRSAIGAKVRIKATINGNSFWQLREVPAQTGYNSQTLTLHFGLGDAATVDSIKVEWPSGNDDIFTNAPSNRHLYIAERDSSAPALSAPADLASNLMLPDTLSWNYGYYWAPYWLQVSSDPLFGGGFLVNDSTIADTFKVLNSSDSAAVYFWRIRSTRSIYRSSWSVPRMFTIGGFGINILGKWNMVSLPVIPPDATTAALFPTAISGAYRFNDTTYVQQDTLKPGTGYWIKFSSAQTVRFTGGSVAAETLAVEKGWNLIGTIGDPLSVEAVVGNPPDTFGSSFFEYDRGYHPVTTLSPGKGYWIKCDSAGTIILSSGSIMHQ
ncbi:MAG TPA: CRTAC1 family protein [Bacteroidota bacterium]|nr:CRTAC1 family protein [Bacteroidota bacterium]